MRCTIQWRDIWFNWKHFQTVNHEPSAIRIANYRANLTGKAYRVVDGKGSLLHLVNP